ncbi:MAG: hypothetical protein WC860_06585 [Candidatus Margulisiibacteriota bacterium]|jgi:hypothetical protein
MKKLKILSLIIISLFFLNSCNENQKIVVRNASIIDVANVLKDYAGINGFNITYAREDVSQATYKVYAGRSVVNIPGQTNTNYSSSTSGQTTYGTATTYKTPDQQINVDWFFILQLSQNNNDVYIQTQSSGGIDPGRYIRTFIESLNNYGFKVEIQQ